MPYYLDADFEPKKLTKAELRSILASHGIVDLPPATAKKDELLDLFYREIIAKREAILGKMSSVKAKSDGIIMLDETSRPSPKKPKAPAKQTRATSIERHSVAPDERPATPSSAATYKLVSRLEKLEPKTSPSRAHHKLVKTYWKECLLGLSICVLLVSYIYLKFWFNWPVYTDAQLEALERKPRLYLKCPYGTNSPIGSCADGRLYCSSGYVEKRLWLGVGTHCVLDRERLSLLESMKKRIVYELQTRAGYSECYQNVPAHLSKQELRQITAKYFKNLKPKTFSDYFDVCTKSLLQDGSKIESATSDSMQLTFIAKKPVYSYYCHVKVALRRTVSERPLEIIVGIFVLLLATSLSIRLELKRRKNKTINHYYLMICRILKDQALQHRNDPSVPTFIAINQLRDAVLIKASSREKSQLWPKVAAEISKNSNIVESITNFRGEQGRIWEWIGADVQI